MATNNTYVTTDVLNKFATDLENYVQDAIQKDDVEFAGVIKEYVEGRLSDLEKSLVNSKDWIEVKSTIDALLKVFDTNKDGTLSPAEILAKIGEIKGSIDAVAGRVSKVEGNVDNINKTIGGIQSDITGVKTQVEKVKAEIESKLGESVTDLEKNVSGNVSEIVDEFTKAVTGAFVKVTENVTVRMEAVRAKFGLPVKEPVKSAQPKVEEAKKAEASKPAQPKAGDGATL